MVTPKPKLKHPRFARNFNLRRRQRRQHSWHHGRNVKFLQKRHTDKDPPKGHYFAKKGRKRTYYGDTIQQRMLKEYEVQKKRAHDENNPNIDKANGSKWTRDLIDDFDWPSSETEEEPPWHPTPSEVNLLLESIDPLQQAQTIRALNDISMFSSKRERKDAKQQIQSSLLAAIHLTQDETSRKTVYYSKKRKELPIVIDTGASYSVTPNVDDFVGPIQPCKIDKLQGLDTSIAVQGEGMVEWRIRDLYGTVRLLRTRAYLVEKAGVRLFSPQTYMQKNKKSSLTMDGSTTKLTLNDGSTITFPFSNGGNLPLMLTTDHFDRTVHVAGLTLMDIQPLNEPDILGTYLNVADETNQNLTEAQRELLLWHQKLGHLDQQTIQMLLAEPRNDEHDQVIKPKNARASACPRPMCLACNLAKMGRRGANATFQIANPETQDGIRRDALQPGQRVSVDQFMSATLGSLLHTRGREAKSKKYTGGTIFVDHATQFVHISNQTSLRVGETLQAKTKFEQFARQHGRNVQAYHADNAPFRAEEFLRDCMAKGQEIDYSGVGAHHQNGVVERAIRTVTSLARAMLLHAAVHWPEEAKLDIWPMALEQAVMIWNNTPKRQTRMSPYELFTGSKGTNYNMLRRLHVFGCPTYVLEPKLQDGKKIPKWHPRSRRGMYLGCSTEHSTTVGRILNLNTGSISPQFHCVYDDMFATVGATDEALLNPERINPDVWERLIESGYEQTLEQDYDRNGRALPMPELDDEWLSQRERQLRRQIRRERLEQRRATRFRDPQEPEWEPRRPRDPGENDQAPQNQREIPNLPHPESDNSSETTETVMPDIDMTSDEESIVEGDAVIEDDEVELPSTRSGRQRRAPRRLIEEINVVRERTVGFPSTNQAELPQKVRRGQLNDGYLNTLNWDRMVNLLEGGTLSAMFAEMEMNTDQDLNTIEWMDPSLLNVKANSSDLPTWNEAMNGPDAEGYWQACRKEIATLESMNVWEVVDRAEWMNVIPSTWAFRCKRYPDGLIKKLKARFCARGDRQIEGVDYFETYAPVVNWQTVRVMLIMSIVLQLATVQVDYTAAFVHADIDRDPNWEKMSDEERQKSGVYLEMPRGFAESGKELKLKKSLYGLKQAPRNFFQHLKTNLETVGYTQSKADPCLFVSQTVICLVYVDDTLFFAKDQKDIDQTIEDLRDQGMTLEVEEDVAGFLGVNIDRKDDGKIEMTQTGLIARIIRALNIGDRPTKETPAELGCLGKDEDGTPAQGTYSYASVIGMLQYLQGHSRPDITFAVSQCARFTHSPKRSHEVALERIGQYLKGTADKGLIFDPLQDSEMKVDCYVDADFAGMWGNEERQDPSCVKSRTGYVIFIQNCPVVWMSKLQSDIALSTMESEYNALSMSMRDVIPLRTMLQAVLNGLGLDKMGTTNFCKTEKKVATQVHEDNTGAMRLAQMEPGRMTPRSKHYGVKYHWFRSQLKPNEIEIVRVETKLQRADFLTKSLRSVTFAENRKMTCGW